MKMTSAVANKMIRRLTEDKSFWRTKENEGATYVAALDEQPVIPNYDYVTVAGEIASIDEKIAILKHAINLNNVTNTVVVGARSLTIDEVLVRMAQLNERKRVLDYMRKRDPQVRLSTSFAARKTAPEYEYINYDLELVKKEFELVDEEISAMQLALDKYNQTFEFEVEI